MDGVAYYVTAPINDSSSIETARRLDSSTIPPLNSIFTSLNDATPSQQATIASTVQAVTCLRFHLVELTLFVWGLGLHHLQERLGHRRRVPG